MKVKEKRRYDQRHFHHKPNAMLFFNSDQYRPLNKIHTPKDTDPFKADWNLNRKFPHTHYTQEFIKNGVPQHRRY